MGLGFRVYTALGLGGRGKGGWGEGWRFEVNKENER